MAEPTNQSALNQPAAIAARSPLNLSVLIPFVTAACVIASCAYNFGYFSTLGGSAIQLATLTDITKSAVWWLPVFLPSYGIGALLAFKRTPMSHFQKSIIRNFHILSVKVPYAILLFLFWAFNQYFFSLPEDKSYIYVLLIAGWMIIVENSDFMKTFGFRTHASWALFYMSPITVLMIAFFGASNANNELTTKHTISTVQFTDGRAAKIAIMRSLDRGILYVVPNTGMLGFVQWEKISAVEDISARHGGDIRLCAVRREIWHLPSAYRCTSLFNR